MIIYKDKAKPMDIIIVYNKKSWFHRIIKGVTGYKAGHVALYLGDGMISEANSTGIHRKPWKNYNNNCMVYLGRYLMMTEQQELAIRKYAIDMEGREYSFFQLAGMVIKNIFKTNKVPDVSKQAMICSEFIANAYKTAGIHLSLYYAHNTSPADILRSRLLCVIKGWK